MRVPMIAGNWKMNKDHREAVELVRELAGLITDLDGVEVLVCPPFTAVADVARTLKELHADIKLGAQNVYPQPEGAFTGEISPGMLMALSVDYVIVGHSERREIIGEKDDLVAAKIRAALENGMVPILCVGETLKEREAGEAMGKVRNQLDADLVSLTGEELAGMVVAYEPIWAIGTGKTATSQDAQEMASFIRLRLAEEYGREAAEKTRILYGGSVKAANIEELMGMEDIDGALVGGASLDAVEFAAIACFQS